MASPIPAPPPDSDDAAAGPQAGGAPAAIELPGDASPLWLVGLRDVAIAAATLSLWAAADAWYGVSGLGLAAVLATIDGLLVGAVIAGIAHEWGHFAGARLSGGTAPLAPAKQLLPLFAFDFSRSQVTHFQAMSIAGNVTPFLVGLSLLLLLPLDTPGRVALVSAAFGSAAFALTVELPVMRRVRAGMEPRESLGLILPEGGIRRGAAVGLLTFGLLFALL